ncbi:MULTISPECIES: CAP domain-containing protein [unclassified Legionella]|uniref:CAP domain-containing protein n=1 Tax=unclassified Legionella TaxID=2622702 RepID=UPI001F5E5A2D|nr:MULTISPECIES: CAP domain-containing protein [unclassified Legionella]MDI9818671.1 CAP domain-containing protein [Legionella sp. PL877]
MKKITSLITSIILTFLLSLPSFATIAPLSPEKERQFQKMVLDEVNHYRASKGLNNLALNEDISKEARQHSLDMAEKNMKFGHQDFDKRVTHIKASIPDFAGGAENIACFKLPPKQVVQKWLTSRGHRRNIEGRYNLTGVGIVQDAKGWIYYTQIFVRDNRL